MQEIELSVGDLCWCYVGNHKGKLSKGKVVHILNLKGWPCKHYVIEIPTGVEPLLEIRDGLTVSDRAKGPIGFLRRPLSNGMCREGGDGR
jgi:hypothetical protein